MPCDTGRRFPEKTGRGVAVKEKTVLLAAVCVMFIVCPALGGVADTATGQAFHTSDAPDLSFPEAMDDPVFADTNAVTQKNRTYLSGHYTFSVSGYLLSRENRPGKTGDRGIDALKSSLFLRLDVDLWDGYTARAEGRGFYDAVYALKGENQYTRQVIQENQSGLEVVNWYVDGRISDQMDLRIGRQVVVWGRSDTVRITDVVNPVDLSIPGRTSLDELRMPVFMVKMDYYASPFALSALMVPEKRWNRYPVFGSRFYPYFFPSVQANETIADFANMDLGVSLSGYFSGWDLSFYTVKYTDKTPHVKLPGVLPWPHLEHAGLVMAGMAADMVWNNFVFKTEAAFTDGIRFSDDIDNRLNKIFLSDSAYSRFDLLLGLEYSGFKNSYVLVDVTSRRINGYDRLLEQGGICKNTFQASVKWIRSFSNGRTAVTAHTAWEGKTAQGGAIHRIKLTREMSDRLSVSLGAVWYHSGNSRWTRDIGKNDMLFLDVTRYF